LKEVRTASDERDAARNVATTLNLTRKNGGVKKAAENFGRFLYSAAKKTREMSGVGRKKRERSERRRKKRRRNRVPTAFLLSAFD
jgi:hypothetical protein